MCRARAPARYSKRAGVRRQLANRTGNRPGRAADCRQDGFDAGRERTGGQADVGDGAGDFAFGPATSQRHRHAINLRRERDASIVSLARDRKTRIKRTQCSCSNGGSKLASAAGGFAKFLAGLKSGNDNAPKPMLAARWRRTRSRMADGGPDAARAAPTSLGRTRASFRNRPAACCRVPWTPLHPSQSSRATAWRATETCRRREDEALQRDPNRKQENTQMRMTTSVCLGPTRIVAAEAKSGAASYWARRRTTGLGAGYRRRWSAVLRSWNRANRGQTSGDAVSVQREWVPAIRMTLERFVDGARKYTDVQTTRGGSVRHHRPYFRMDPHHRIFRLGPGATATAVRTARTAGQVQHQRPGPTTGNGRGDQPDSDAGIQDPAVVGQQPGSGPRHTDFSQPGPGFGTCPGVTQLNVWDENKKLYTVDVVVTPDGRQLRDADPVRVPRRQRARPAAGKQRLSVRLRPDPGDGAEHRADRRGLLSQRGQQPDRWRRAADPAQDQGDGSLTHQAASSRFRLGVSGRPGLCVPDGQRAAGRRHRAR